MKTRIARFTAAFSLIEILVTIALLSFIILGLLGMFTQTQRAFRQSMTQTDLLENGRGLMSFIVPEIEQIAPADLWRTTNFFVELPAMSDPGVASSCAQIYDRNDPTTYRPVYQELPSTIAPLPLLRTNVIQRMFFLRRQNQDWVGTGYQVIGDSPNAGVGTLYRHYATNKPRNGPITLSSNFLTAPMSSLSRIADGVVHFRVTVFDTNGFILTPTNFDRLATQGNRLEDVTGRMNPSGYVDAYFTNNAVPGAVEIELGVLESRTLDRYRAMIGNPAAQRAYLSNHVAQVHLFRQRVPIRNVDAKAYQ